MSVDCTTTEGTAGDETSGDDYQFAAGTLTLAPGETSATLTLVINPDGAEEPDEWFFVDLSAGEPAGAVTIDESRATVTVEDDDDLGPPVVVAVSVAPAGEVAECAKVGVPVLELTAAFDQAMFDPPGDAAAGDVTNPANYLLLASGPDLDFSTTSCSGGPEGDDVAVPIESVSWNGVTFTAAVVLEAAVADGLFELRLCRHLSDLHGNDLDGAGDGTPGEDFTRRFRIERANLFANGHFDHCGTIVPSLAGWDVEVTAPDAVTPDGPDAEGSPLSSSARVESFGADPLAIGQCVPASEGLHTLRARLRTTATPSSLTTATFFCLFFDSASCAGVELATVVASSQIADGGGQFVELSRPMDAPSAVASAWCGIDLAALAQDNAASTTELDGRLRSRARPPHRRLRAEGLNPHRGLRLHRQRVDADVPDVVGRQHRTAVECWLCRGRSRKRDHRSGPGRSAATSVRRPKRGWTYRDRRPRPEEVSRCETFAAFAPYERWLDREPPFSLSSVPDAPRPVLDPRLPKGAPPWPSCTRLHSRSSLPHSV